MKIVSFSLEEGNRYYGKIDGDRFYIGTRVSYEGRKGLVNVAGASPLRYARSQYRERFGFWADFLHPTAMAEGALFHTLNTYDRAMFTFSFLQFAAHVPNGDFVRYLRALLALPLAAEYFPDLILHEGRICKQLDDGPRPLESDTSTAPLMDYLNPTSKEIEDTEVVQAAKFVHWVQHDADHRRTQVEVGVANIRRNMADYARQYKLDNVADTVCLVVADIRHQGRAKSPEIVAALQSSDPLGRLLDIGASRYPERIAVLRREIAAMKQDGTLGQYKYSTAKRDFVEK